MKSERFHIHNFPLPIEFSTLPQSPNARLQTQILPALTSFPPFASGPTITTDSVRDVQVRVAFGALTFPPHCLRDAEDAIGGEKVLVAEEEEVLTGRLPLQQLILQEGIVEGQVLLDAKVLEREV